MSFHTETEAISLHTKAPRLAGLLTRDRSFYQTFVKLAAALML